MKLKRFYYKHGAYYYVDPTGKWHHLGKAKAQAIAHYAQLLERPVVVLMRDVFSRFEREILPEKSALTQRDYRAGLRLLGAVFDDFQPDQVTPVMIYAYMDHRKAPTRANREKALLSQVFSYAVRWGYATRNPCREVKSFKEKPRTRYVTDEEFWAAYDLAPVSVQRAMVLAVTTGLRLSDILALDSSCVTEEGLLVVPSKTKNSTGKALLFAWSDLLAEHTGTPEENARRLKPVPLVSTTSNGHYTRSGFQTLWQRLMKRLPEAARFTFHDLRAKAGSDHADGSILGHADGRTLNRHYRRKPERVDPLPLPKR